MPIVKKYHRSMCVGSTRSMRGASLIEVLISVLLAAIGLLALVGSNVASVRYSKMSQYRGIATMLSADLAERMRANPNGLASYAVSSNFAAQATPPTPNTGCDGYLNTCTAAQMAAYDLASWQLIVRSQLPDGSVSVVPSTAVAGADVWLSWRDPAVASPDDNSTDARNYSKECSPSFSTDKSVRCAYFRINL